MTGPLTCLWVCLGVWWAGALHLEPVHHHLTALLPSSRVGLDWACSMAEILRSLNSAPLWRDVVATFTDHCIKQLPFQLKHTNIFTLLVLVGFPQVHLSEGLVSSSCLHQAYQSPYSIHPWEFFFPLHNLLLQYWYILKILGWFVQLTFLTV